MPALQAVDLILSAWRILVTAAGTCQIGIGIAMLLNGPNGFPAGGLFTAANFLPWWIWGTWAMLAGAITLTHARFIGLSITVAWYGGWGAILMIGAVTSGHAWYAIPLYTFLIVMHVLIAVVDRRVRKLTTRARAATA